MLLGGIGFYSTKGELVDVCLGAREGAIAATCREEHFCYVQDGLAAKKTCEQGMMVKEP